MSRMIPTKTQIHCGAPMVGLLPPTPWGKPPSRALDPGGAQACKMLRLSSREGLQTCVQLPPGSLPRLATR
jgi:hypothetical protein